MAQISKKQVWSEINKQLFAVLGMVTKNGEARTAGIVYVEHDEKLYISSQKQGWKTKHIAQNPNVSLTIPIHKHIPFMPWIKIPAAIISFAGKAGLLEPGQLPAEIKAKLFQGQELPPTDLAELIIIEIVPCGNFATYGIGVPLMAMRDPDQARGRV